MPINAFLADPVAGAVVATSWGTDVVDTLLAQENRDRWRLYTTSTGSNTFATSGNRYVMTWENESYDPASRHGGSNSYVTIATDGMYDVRACVGFGTNSTGDRSVAICRVGTGATPDTSTTHFLIESGQRAASAIPTVIQVVDAFQCTAGDRLYVVAFQSSGGSLAITGAAYDCVFSGMRLSSV